jgi:hypothetical protein
MFPSSVTNDENIHGDWLKKPQRWAGMFKVQSSRFKVLGTLESNLEP